MQVSNREKEIKESTPQMPLQHKGHHLTNKMKIEGIVRSLPLVIDGGRVPSAPNRRCSQCGILEKKERKKKGGKGGRRMSEYSQIQQET
jgi:hypothetical protein